MQPPTIPVPTLVALGRCVLSQTAVPDALLEPLRKYDVINRLNPETWEAVTKSISDDELVALFRGVIATEQLLGWAGGSVAAGVWVYREIVGRGGDLADREAEWALANSSNPWIPFGTNRLGASTLAEYRGRRTRRNSQIQQGLKQQLESELEAARDRANAETQRRRAAEHRRTAIRQKFIADLDAIPVDLQLEQLANDGEYPIEWYPTKLASLASVELLRGVSPEIRQKLIGKCAGRHRGAWARFKRRLLAVAGTAAHRNRRPWFR